MKLRAKVQLVALSTTIVVAAVAGASARTGDRAGMFGDIDADGNGSITQEEIAAHAAARFAATDTDGDGFLTPEEMSAARDAMRLERSARMVKELDTDGDGALNAQELAAGGEGRAGKGRSGKWQARMMDRMDSDKDGKLSLEEMTARRDPARMFERLDADGDGALSAEEFGKMRGHGGKRHHGDKG
ncbi:EF-hand domain-containing protein [Sulfitobacter sp. EhC04]|uniref:EF-hand domain-containing protein n=1 Tax=Sulfitobacter sp. EhC04 TaxID=1849168 RepID=UPI000829FB68|nr:EF-hand domain-containing protein [Sulfitobacter sp. EhC04]